MSRGRGRGRRFDEGPKLNKKKVFATFLAVLVIVMVISSIIIIIKQGKKEELSNENIKYFAFCSNNDNKDKITHRNPENGAEETINPQYFGVINSKGEIVVPANYDTVIVPDKNKALFIRNDKRRN